LAAFLPTNAGWIGSQALSNIPTAARITQFRPRIVSSSRERQASAKWSHGRRSLGKICRVGLNAAASSKVPTWKCISVEPSPSHVKVDPHFAQNPRRRPGDELNFVIAPSVTL
jgi:hypothetical protein